MQIKGHWIERPGTQQLCAALRERGYQALFVGGCVRNALMGLPVADIDLCSDALPETVTKIAQEAGFKVVPTGVEHGTVTVVADHIPHEVTTFRRDVETDGRRAVVAFSQSILEDAARRDLTINALYAQADGTVIDPLNGLADLQAGRVRFVGNADQRIREDYLRILRFFRFHAHYADPRGGIDAEALAACSANLDGINGLSRERIGHEFRKLLSAADPAPAVAAMQQSGVLAAVLPGADARALAPLVHLEDGLAPDWRRRLVVLGGEDVADRLKLGRSESRAVAAMAEAIGSNDSPAALGFLLNDSLGTGAVLTRAAVMQAPLDKNWAAEVKRGAAAIFPVRAADLPDLTGAALGLRLSELQRIWLRGGLTASKAELLGQARDGTP